MTGGGRGTRDSPARYEVLTRDWAVVGPMLRWRIGRLLSETTTRTSTASGGE